MHCTAPVPVCVSYHLRRSASTNVALWCRRGENVNWDWHISRLMSRWEPFRPVLMTSFDCHQLLSLKERDRDESSGLAIPLPPRAPQSHCLPGHGLSAAPEIDLLVSSLVLSAITHDSQGYSLISGRLFCRKLGWAALECFRNKSVFECVLSSIPSRDWLWIKAHAKWPHTYLNRKKLFSQEGKNAHLYALE